MIDILRTRRSIRKYINQKIEEDKIEIIKEAILRSPSGRGVNPWTFIFVDDRDLLDKLSRSKEHGSALLKGAALGIVMCGNEKESDTWIEDCSIAAIIAQLTAHSLGLGSCWVHLRNRMHSKETSSESYVRELLNIPSNISIDSIIGIGYPDEKKEPHAKESLQYDKIRYNSY